MFKARTTAKTLQFPVLDEAPVVRPAWLEDLRELAPRLVFPETSTDPLRPQSLAPNERHSAAPRNSEHPLPGAADRASQSAPAAAGSAPEAPPSAAGPHLSAAPAVDAGAAHGPEGTASAGGAAQQQQVDVAHPSANLSGQASTPEHAPSAPAQHAQQHANEPEAHEPQLEDRVWSRLPPPPQLGSLIPGGRSAPPPANDTGLELLQEQRDAFTNAAVELGIARAATISVMEGQLLDLAVEIAQALIEREVERNPELHGALARAALSSLGESERVTLRTSHEAYQAICQTLGGPETTVRGVHVQVHADDAIPGLGCVVDGENVRIDATVAERLRAVRRAFEDERRKTAESSE